MSDSFPKSVSSKWNNLKTQVTLPDYSNMMQFVS